MNRFELLVSESQIAVVLAGIPSLGRFQLLPINDSTDDAVEIASRSGFQFLGCVGLTISNGKFVPRMEFTVELTNEHLKLIADQFFLLVERAIVRVENASWLEQLHALPDPRAN
jgi:hypothetical protein